MQILQIEDLSVSGIGTEVLRRLFVDKQADCEGMMEWHVDSPGVLAEHQVVEVQKLRDKYIEWEEQTTESQVRAEKIKAPALVIVSLNQMRVTLNMVVRDLTKILEQT